jgi:hypothetical protein
MSESLRQVGQFASTGDHTNSTNGIPGNEKRDGEAVDGTNNRKANGRMWQVRGV